MGVVEQVVVAVEVVFGNIEHGGGGGVQMVGVFQLEAGKFEHPHVGALLLPVFIGFEHGRTDIAGHHGIQPAFAAQMADQAGYGGFAVAAGDGDDFVALAGKLVRQNFHIAQHTAAGLFEGFDFGRALADAGAECQNVETCGQCGFQVACVAGQAGETLLQFGLFGGGEVGIISGYRRAFAAQEIQHGNAAAAHPGHEDFLVLPFAFHSILHAARFCGGCFLSFRFVHFDCVETCVFR